MVVFPALDELANEKKPGAKKGKIGRPALPAGEKRKPRSIKLSDDEWQEIQRRASDSGVSAAEYIRLKTLAGD